MHQCQQFVPGLWTRYPFMARRRVEQLRYILARHEREIVCNCINLNILHLLFLVKKDKNCIVSYPTIRKYPWLCFGAGQVHQSLPLSYHYFRHCNIMNNIIIFFNNFNSFLCFYTLWCSNSTFEWLLWTGEELSVICISLVSWHMTQETCSVSLVGIARPVHHRWGLHSRPQKIYSCDFFNVRVEYSLHNSLYQFINSLYLWHDNYND